MVDATDRFGIDKRATLVGDGECPLVERYVHGIFGDTVSIGGHSVIGIYAPTGPDRSPPGGLCHVMSRTASLPMTLQGLVHPRRQSVVDLSIHQAEEGCLKADHPKTDGDWPQWDPRHTHPSAKTRL